MATSSSSSKPHVAVIAFPFTSHPKSLFNLVVKLGRASPNTRFTFLNTPTSNSELFSTAAASTIPPNLQPSALDDGIPPGNSPAELGFARSTELFYSALLRPGSLRASLESAAASSGEPITCLLVDAVLSVFLADLADSDRLPWVAVWSPSPWALSAYAYTDLIRRRCTAVTENGDGDVDQMALDFVPGLTGMKVSDHWPRQMVVGELDERFRFLHCLARIGGVLPRAAAVVLNSFRELNPADLNSDMAAKFNRVFNVGFFTVSVPVPPPEDSSDPTGCMTWLDGKDPKSVVYISFGTVGELSETETKAMAEALEESRVSFLWSLPEIHGKLLPTGFIERTTSYGQGKVVTWTEQVKVLRHGAVGAFVTHCGCNSVNESIANGVPIIARPFWADNQINAKMVDGVWGMGTRVVEESDGVLTKGGFIQALELVLKREEGKRIRERALELKKLVIEAAGPTGSGTRDFNALIGLLSNVHE